MNTGRAVITNVSTGYYQSSSVPFQKHGQGTMSGKELSLNGLCGRLTGTVCSC